MALSTVSYAQQRENEFRERHMAFCREQQKPTEEQRQGEQSLAVRVEQLESEVQKLKDIVLK